MGLRRPGVVKDYEEMPGANIPVNASNGISRSVHHHPHLPPHHHPRNIGLIEPGAHPMGQDLEMSSVSVVPDGWFHFFSLALLS